MSCRRCGRVATKLVHRQVPGPVATTWVAPCQLPLALPISRHDASTLLPADPPAQNGPFVPYGGPFFPHCWFGPCASYCCQGSTSSSDGGPMPTRNMSLPLFRPRCLRLPVPDAAMSPHSPTRPLSCGPKQLGRPPRCAMAAQEEQSRTRDEGNFSDADDVPLSVSIVGIIAVSHRHASLVPHGKYRIAVSDHRLVSNTSTLVRTSKNNSITICSPGPDRSWGTLSSPPRCLAREQARRTTSAR